MTIKNLLIKCIFEEFPNEELIAHKYIEWNNKGTTGCTLIEYQILYALVKLVQPKNILEIGPGAGASSAAMLLAAPEAQLQQVTIHQDSGRILIEPADSKRVKTSYMPSDDFFRNVSETYDFVFIDGDHSRDAVVRDVRSSIEHSTPTAVIACHDIAHVGSDYIDEVARTEATRANRIYASIRTGGPGLGIIHD